MPVTPVKRNTNLPERPLGQALWRGLKCRCPNCGEGKLFRAFLKVADTCPNCGEALHHHRADDAPAYLVIFVLGHIIVGAMLHIEMSYTLPPLLYLSILLPLTVVLALAMLPPAKGAVVGLQWAHHMHGFDPAHDPETDM